MGTIAQLFESGEQTSQKGMFNNLVMLARVDGKVDTHEVELLSRIAKSLSLTPEQVSEIIQHPDQYPMVPPANKEERAERFVQFVQMMYADGVIDPKEVDLGIKYGVALGYDENAVQSIEEKIIELVKQNTDTDSIIAEILK